MFSKPLNAFCLTSVLVATVFGQPTSVVRRHPSNIIPRGQSDVSFNNLTNLSSLSSFDNFFGPSNFNGNNNQEVIIQEKTVQCHQQDVTLIQQRLTVLRELVKKVIVQQVCEVEVQTVVLKQFQSGIESFSQDVRHVTTRQVSFDESITALFSQIQDQLGNLSSHDLGFSGSQVGNSSIIANGSNWNNQTSPASVGAIYNASMAAGHQANNGKH